jgi:hypothetical protein
MTEQYLKLLQKFRVESLNVKSMTGASKILGTLISLGGVMLLSLYTGVPVSSSSSSSSQPPYSNTCIILRQQELDVGNRSITGQLPLLLLLVAASDQAHKDVSGALL